MTYIDLQSRKQSNSTTAPTGAPAQIGASAGYGRAFTVTTVFIDGNPSAMRLIKSCGTRLSVLAAPFAEALARVRSSSSPWDYVVYVIDDPSPASRQKTYIGHGDGERKSSETGSATPSARLRRFTSSSPTKHVRQGHDLLYRSKMIRICTDLNIPLANARRPTAAAFASWTTSNNWSATPRCSCPRPASRASTWRAAIRPYCGSGFR